MMTSVSTNSLEKRCGQAWTMGVLIPFITSIAAKHDIKPDVVWETLSYNDYLCFDLVRNNVDKPWNWYRVTMNPNITMDMIINHPYVPWNLKSISRNPNLTIEMVLKYANHEVIGPDICNDASSHANITMEHINQYPNVAWNWDQGVSNNPNLTIAFLRQHLDEAWGWVNVTRNPNINMEMIQNNPDLPWSDVGLSYNPNITTNMIFSRPIETLDWSGLSYNKALDLSNTVLKHPEYPWNWRALAIHPSLTIDIVLALPSVRWNLRSLSEHKNITIPMIVANPDIKWSWQNVAKNPNLTLELFMSVQEFSRAGGKTAVQNSCMNEGVIVTVNTISKNVNNRGNYNMMAACNLFSSEDQCYEWQHLARLLSRNPNLSMDVISTYPDFEWDWIELVSHCYSNDMKKHYIETVSRRLALLSLMDEDYHREEGTLDRNNVFDLVFQNEFIISRMFQYV